jgi:hypothetical protein
MGNPQRCLWLLFTVKEERPTSRRQSVQFQSGLDLRCNLSSGETRTNAYLISLGHPIVSWGLHWIGQFCFRRGNPLKPERSMQAAWFKHAQYTKQIGFRGSSVLPTNPAPTQTTAPHFTNYFSSFILNWVKERESGKTSSFAFQLPCCCWLWSKQLFS